MVGLLASTRRRIPGWRPPAARGSRPARGAIRRLPGGPGIARQTAEVDYRGGAGEGIVHLGPLRQVHLPVILLPEPARLQVDSQDPAARLPQHPHERSPRAPLAPVTTTVCIASPPAHNFATVAARGEGNARTGRRAAAGAGPHLHYRLRPQPSRPVPRSGGLHRLGRRLGAPGRRRAAVRHSAGYWHVSFATPVTLHDSLLRAVPEDGVRPAAPGTDRRPHHGVPFRRPGQELVAAGAPCTTAPWTARPAPPS